MPELKEISDRLKFLVREQQVGVAKQKRRSLSITIINFSALLHKSELVQEEVDRKPTHLFICLTSDRGLCGGIHSSMAKAVRNIVKERGANSNTGLVLIGDKLRGILQRTHRNNILLAFNEIGRKPPVFAEASFIAQEILCIGYEFESAEIVFNTFKLVDTTKLILNVQIYSLCVSFITDQWLLSGLLSNLMFHCRH